MKILITSIVDLKRVTHNRIHAFVDHLSRKHDVTVLCLNAWWLEEGSAGRGGSNYHSEPYFQEMFDRTRILYLSQGKPSAVLQELMSLRTLDSLLREINLASFDVHVNYSNLISGYSVARKAKSLGIPTVLDIADDLTHSFRESSQVPRLLRPVAGLVARTMLAANIKLASRVTVINQALEGEYGLADAKSVLIPNGVHGEFFVDVSPRALRRHLGIEGDFVLGFVGALLEWVDVEPAFAALKGLAGWYPDVKMLIVGGGEKLRESKKLADAYGISDRVIFTAQVPLSEVPEYISGMDVCLICRRTTRDSDHSLPLKLFEYMACEKPIISTRLAGVREAVGDGVLYASHGAELQARVLDFYHDRRLGKKLGVQGRAFVRQNHTWSTICSRFEEVLDEAASRSTVKSPT